MPSINAWLVGMGMQKRIRVAHVQQLSRQTKILLRLGMTGPYICFACGAGYLYVPLDRVNGKE